MLLDRAVEIASPLVEQRRHELTVTVARQGLIVDVDPIRMVQVLSNLLTNAAKYTEAGGRIRVSAQLHEGQVELTVADNGIGISADMLPHVFELFVQERQAIDRARGGLGLGLAIVQNLALMHDGAVSVQSDGLGLGSAFTVSLPAVQGPARTVLPAGDMSLPDQYAKYFSVLVVDDSPDEADTFSQLHLRPSSSHGGRMACESASCAWVRIKSMDSDPSAAQGSVEGLSRIGHYRNRHIRQTNLLR